VSDRYDDCTDVNDLFDRYWRATMDDSPETATYVGWHEHHDRWTDATRENIERLRAEVAEPLTALRRIDRSALSEGDRLSCDVFEAQLVNDVALAPFPNELLAIDQMDGPQNEIPLVLSITPIGDGGDYLSRLRGIPALLEQRRALLEEGLRRGITVPAICLRDVPEQVEAHLGDVAESPEVLPLAGEPEALRREAEAVVREEVQPAYRALRDFLVDTYIPGARQSIAFTELPDGPEWYAAFVRHHPTTDLSPQEIHDVGVAEVERIGAAMRDVMQQIGFSGTKAEFAEHLATDPRFYFESEDALLAFYRDIAKRIDPAVPKLFRLLPRLPFGIVAVPLEQAQSAAAAFYVQGSLALGRPGTFYANTYDLKSRPSWNMESICLHEAVPGHHFQIAIAQELDGLPEFRRQSLANTAYIEGWGLYCESLGTEMGMYTDPYQRYGALDAELLRAIRLVLDTGMHALGWSRDRAIDYFAEHSASPRHEIITEVDRYLVLPGQALAYKVGERKLQELRRRYPAADVRDFHEEVLRHGALPLGILEQLVDARFAAT
jgi:uncharacterized protein (DUF885 family)